MHRPDPGTLPNTGLPRRLVRDVAAPDLAATKPARHARAQPRAQPAFVLVVDDNPVNLLVVSEMLACCGISAMLAADGAQAAALACEHRPKLVLMDLQMPVLDGVGAAKEIRRFEHEHALPRMPIVAYTTSAMSRHALKDYGIDGVLDKPCDLPMLQRCLQAWGVSAPGRGSARCVPAVDQAGDRPASTLSSVNGKSRMRTPQAL